MTEDTGAIGFREEETLVLVAKESVSSKSRLHDRNDALQEEVLKLKNAYNLIWKMCVKLIFHF